ncbi:GNAT family N-acetyltransferase [Novosphingobium huizhouense]|uniref:GNAT family N-acetyltransferase n=1 Tax=Novosphingobium huizhouense TaxID=2866625 RepID=UPI001CD834E8|nr:GNAT family N-acetyltransferase [Novosphingobium huizhouense]
MAIRVYHVDLAEAQADPALASLLGRSATSAPFDRLDWLRLLGEECLGAERCFLAVAREGERIAALPLCETAFGYEQLGNWYSFRVGPRGGDDALLAALVARLRRPLRLQPMLREDAERLARALRRAGWMGRSEPCGVNYFTDLSSGSFEDWWARRPGALRETVRRKGRAGTVALSIATDFADSDWDAYEAVYARSWKPAEASPRFLRRFARAEAEAGALRLGLARIDGEPVAAQFWTVEGGTAWIHKLAHDERFAARSPGTLLSHAMFARAIEVDRVTRIDFGTGADAYKRDWMDAVRPLHALEFHRPFSPASWLRLARLAARALVKRPLVLPPGAG